jgi:hypothetical protein
MPALTVLAVVGLALIALLFVANEKLEPVSPVITTSQRLGLPGSRHHVATQNLSAAPAPAPDMTSQDVLAAQPKSAPDPRAKIGSAARAQAPPKKARVEASAKNARAEASRQGARAEASPQEARSEASAKKGRAEALAQELSVEASAKKARVEPPSQDASSQEAPSQNEFVSQQQFDKFSIKSY